jgi:hypothetical protein
MAELERQTHETSGQLHLVGSTSKNTRANYQRLLNDYPEFFNATYRTESGQVIPPLPITAAKACVFLQHKERMPQREEGVGKRARIEKEGTTLGLSALMTVDFLFFVSFFSSKLTWCGAL